MRISTEKFIEICNDPTDYDKFKKLEELYGDTYRPISKLSKPVKVKTVTKGNVVTRNGIDPKASLDFLLNKNNVFQYGCYVIFVSPDGNNVKQMYAADYDRFIANNPKDVFNIPQDILLNEVFGVLDNAIPMTKTSSEIDIPYGSCTWCFLATIATICTGGGTGALDVLFCLKCYYGIKEYYECEGE